MVVTALPLYQKIRLEWGRGTGKSTILGKVIKMLVVDMPRGSFTLIGESYQQILTRTLPSTILGLEQHGLYQGVHYFIGRQAPAKWNWPRSYQPPKDYSRYITFWNGAGIHLISQDKAGDGRGLNIDAEIADEAALLSKQKLDENTSPTLRGSNTGVFKNRKMFAKSVYATSTPLTLDGTWFTDEEDMAHMSPKWKYYYLKADYRVNAHNLRPGFIEDAKSSTIPWIFNAEYLNIRPNRTKNSFYAQLQEEIHTYSNFNYSHYTTVRASVDSRGDSDCFPTLPLTIGVDFGMTINCLSVAQNLQSINELRTLKSMYVLGDNKEMQDDLADNFAKYYEYHTEKTVMMWYDNTGNNRTGNTRSTKAEQFANRLRAKGWKVVLMTTGGANPYHDLKHRLWELLLAGHHPSLPKFTLNKPNCRELWISMSNAKAKFSNSGSTEKDKSSERSRKIPRQLATDLSDSLDSIIVGMFIHYVSTSGRILPG